MDDETFGTFITDASGSVAAIEHANNMRIAYTAKSEDEYVFHWTQTMPNSFNIRMSGLEV